MHFVYFDKAMKYSVNFCNIKEAFCCYFFRPFYPLFEIEKQNTFNTLVPKMLFAVIPLNWLYLGVLKAVFKTVRRLKNNFFINQFCFNLFCSNFQHLNKRKNYISGHRLKQLC